MSRPTQLRAGSKYEWEETFDLEAGETLNARLLLGSGAPKEYTVVTDGNTHTITIPASLLAAVTPGTYEQVIYAETGSGDDAEQRMLVDEFVPVLANVSSDSATLYKSFNRQRVEYLRATYLSLTQQLHQQVGHTNRTVLYRRINEIKQELIEAERALQEEEDAAVAASGGTVQKRNVALVTFVNP